MKELDYKFEDLFDKDKIQHLTDVIGLALGVEIVVVSIDGLPITTPSGFHNLEAPVEQMKLPMTANKIPLASFLVRFSKSQVILHRSEEKQIREMLEVLIQQLAELGWENYKQKRELLDKLRLEETARLAKAKGFDYFCTTLSISPLKNSQKINEIGFEIAEKYGVKWLPSDFKKKDGYKRSIELSAEYGLYRQNYCGCVYSRTQNTEG